MAYLKYAYRNPRIYGPLYEALPIAGIDGTLKYRMRKGKAFRHVRAKTGTVTGICSLAGYASGISGHLYAFVIIRGIWNGPLKRFPLAGCATEPSRWR